jgi:putative PIG3 family NAD(P)H quinone oxidoreductase
MRAILIDDGNLNWAETESPQLAAQDVMIDVHATAINRADLVQRAGLYPPPPGASQILGLECSGTIAAVGSETSRFKVGDKVCALLSGGGYAEQVAVPEAQVAPVPDGMSLLDAAAIVEVFATAYLNLYMEAAMKPGERALVHAGASGVGTAAIQLCRAFGNPIMVTVGGQDKVQRCLALGADCAADRHTQDLAEAVGDWAPQGVDVILDPVGAGYLASNMQSLGVDGRLVIIGLMGGAQAELNIGAMMVKRQRIIGSTLRARPVAAKGQVMRALEERVWPLFSGGSLKPVIEQVFPIAEADAAHQLVASNKTVGKVLLQVG